MKILFLDIETAPNKAYVWGFFDQNISANQLEASSYILCWAAKWADNPRVHFDSVQKDTRRQMLRGVHKLLDEADVVIHYNGTKFDIPTLNKEFIKHGFPPPSPYKQLDLYLVARRAFRFESNKMDYVSAALKIGRKVKHEGFELWTKCMKGDAKAWKKMGHYNRGDVTLLEKLYKRLQPWIERHPNHSAFMDKLACPKCGSEKTQRRGDQVALTRTYRRYQCLTCGGWFRGNKSIAGARGEIGTNTAL